MLREVVAAVATILLAFGTAAAHPGTSAEGRVLLPVPEQGGVGSLALVRSLAGLSLPDGVASWTVRDVNGGHFFQLRASGGDCPYALSSPDAADFDIYFTAGSYENGLCDEAGVVPGDGDAVVVLYYGASQRFTYAESHGGLGGSSNEEGDEACGLLVLCR